MLIRFLKIYAIVISLLLILVGGFVAYVHWPVSVAGVEVDIAKGASLRTIAAQLEKNEVTPNHWMFIAYVRYRGVQRDIRAGEYHFEGKINAIELLDRLLKGTVKVYPVTFLEGWTCQQMADHLETLTFLEEANFSALFYQLCFSEEVARQFALPAKSLEGFLFPETYNISASIKPLELAGIMIGEFQKVYQNEVMPRLTIQNFNQLEIVTMASIVEKEAGNTEEMPLIASVFHNRLKRKMRLQADPTIIYGLENYDGNIRRRDIENPHPYNTYVHSGLPPGPIANPGREALIATVAPAKTKYLYFVAKGKGEHHFSKTLVEHNAAVQKYQLRRRSSK